MNEIEEENVKKQIKIAYDKGRAEEQQRILKIIEGFKKEFGEWDDENAHSVCEELRQEIQGEGK